MQKMIKKLLGNYPYRRITAVLLLLCVIILCFAFKNKETESEGTDVVVGSTEQSRSESVTESEEDLTETEGSESFSVDKEEDEALTAEKPVMEETESGKGPESSTIQEDDPNRESQGSVTPDEMSESEILTTPEVIPTSKPTSIPKVTSSPEPTPIPEVTQTPAPEEIPTPESTPESEVTYSPHEHSWIFESWYQEPTCSNGGLVTEICAHCGETQITGGIPSGEHSYEVETPGDCCSEEVVVCMDCNHREVGDKNPDNHMDVEDGFCYGCGKKTN